MPYSARKNGNKITVTKKDTGEVVGHTTPENYKGYMAALHMHESPEEHKMCGGGMVGYAKGGIVHKTPPPEDTYIVPNKKGNDKEQLMDATARNRQEIGLPAVESGVDTLVGQLPVIGAFANLGKLQDIKDRVADPNYLHNTAGRVLGTNVQRGNPNDPWVKSGEVGQAFSEGGVVPNKEKESTEIPEEVKEYIEKMHSDKNNSRPDEGWRIVPPAKADHIANYKKDDEELEDSEPNKIPMDDNSKDKPIIDEEDKALPHYYDGGQTPTDDGGTVFSADDPSLWNEGVQDVEKDVVDPVKDAYNYVKNVASSPVAKATGALTDVTDAVGGNPIPLAKDILPVGEVAVKPEIEGINRATNLNIPVPSNTPPPPAKDISDQGEGNNTSGAADYLASKNAGSGATGNVGKSNLTPTQQALGLDDAQKMAAFMKLLGDKGQNAQLGAGIAGIGDAIASGGTLGKVNPGGLKNSEEMIQNKQKQGVEGYQLVQENSPYSPAMQKALVSEFGIPAALANAPRNVIDKLLPPATNIKLKQMEMTLNERLKQQEIDEARAARQTAAAGEITKGETGILPSWLTSPFTKEQRQGAENATSNVANTGLPSNTSPNSKVTAYAQQYKLTYDQALKILQDRANKQGNK